MTEADMVSGRSAARSASGIGVGVEGGSAAEGEGVGVELAIVVIGGFKCEVEGVWGRGWGPWNCEWGVGLFRGLSLGTGLDTALSLLLHLPPT